MNVCIDPTNELNSRRGRGRPPGTKNKKHFKVNRKSRSSKDDLTKLRDIWETPIRSKTLLPKKSQQVCTSKQEDEANQRSINASHPVTKKCDDNSNYILNLSSSLKYDLGLPVPSNSVQNVVANRKRPRRISESIAQTEKCEIKCPRGRPKMHKSCMDLSVTKDSENINAKRPRGRPRLSNNSLQSPETSEKRLRGRPRGSKKFLDVRHSTGTPIADNSEQKSEVCVPKRSRGRPRKCEKSKSPIASPYKESSCINLTNVEVCSVEKCKKVQDTSSSYFEETYQCNTYNKRLPLEYDSHNMHSSELKSYQHAHEVPPVNKNIAEKSQCNTYNKRLALEYDSDSIHSSELNSYQHDSAHEVTPVNKNIAEKSQFTDMNTFYCTKECDIEGSPISEEKTSGFCASQENQNKSTNLLEVETSCDSVHEHDGIVKENYTTVRKTSPVEYKEWLNISCKDQVNQINPEYEVEEESCDHIYKDKLHAEVCTELGEESETLCKNDGNASIHEDDNNEQICTVKGNDVTARRPINDNIFSDNSLSLEWEEETDESCEERDNQNGSALQTVEEKCGETIEEDDDNGEICAVKGNYCTARRAISDFISPDTMSSIYDCNKNNTFYNQKSIGEVKGTKILEVLTLAEKAMNANENVDVATHESKSILCIPNPRPSISEVINVINSRQLPNEHAEQRYTYEETIIKKHKFINNVNYTDLENEKVQPIEPVCTSKLLETDKSNRWDFHNENEEYKEQETTEKKCIIQ